MQLFWRPCPDRGQDACLRLNSDSVEPIVDEIVGTRGGEREEIMELVTQSFDV